MTELPTHLDTSFLIRAMVRGSAEDRTLRKWLGVGRSLSMSAIAWAEFQCGPLNESQIELSGQIVTQRLPFTEEDAVMAAELFKESGRKRGSLIDCMIAATVVRSGAILATSNRGDFKRLKIDLI